MTTPEQWATDASRWPEAILELRARVEQLEANCKPTPNPGQIGSSLVERVQDAIHDVEFPHGDDEARAAIREVAAWLDENTGGDAAWMLTQEAGR
jgi:hypothetical protein